MDSFENYIQPECCMVTISDGRVICNSGEAPNYNDRDDLFFNWL